MRSFPSTDRTDSEHRSSKKKKKTIASRACTTRFGEFRCWSLASRSPPRQSLRVSTSLCLGRFIQPPPTCAVSSVFFRGRLNALSASSGTVSKCSATSNLFPRWVVGTKITEERGGGGGEAVCCPRVAERVKSPHECEPLKNGHRPLSHASWHAAAFEPTIPLPNCVLCACVYFSPSVDGGKKTTKYAFESHFQFSPHS